MLSSWKNTHVQVQKAEETKAGMTLALVFHVSFFLCVFVFLLSSATQVTFGP